MNIQINPILWTCKFTNNWANGKGYGKFILYVNTY